MEYSAPNCKVVRFHVQNLVCTSPYGVEGQAGADASYNDLGDEY